MSGGRSTSLPARRRRLTREARRAQLLDVAEATFAECGYQGTSLEDITARAGITRPLIYSHFRSKDEIYLECLRSARAELEADFTAAVTSTEGFEEQLRAGFTASFAFFERRPHAWELLYGSGAAVAGAVSEAAAEMRFQTAENIATLLVRAAPEFPRDHAVVYAHAISGAGEQLAKWWRRHPEVTIDVLVDRAMEVTWLGMENLRLLFQRVAPSGRPRAARATRPDRSARRTSRQR